MHSGHQWVPPKAHFSETTSSSPAACIQSSTQLQPGSRPLSTRLLPPGFHPDTLPWMQVGSTAGLSVGQMIAVTIGSQVCMLAPRRAVVQQLICHRAMPVAAVIAGGGALYE